MNVNGHYLKALRHCAATEDIRYYLNGVLLETTAEGKFYVGTEGHRIAVFHEPWDGNEEREDVRIVIPRDVLEALRLPKQRQITSILSKMPDGRWLLDPQVEAAIAFRPIDGKYPEWRGVIPTKVSGAAGNYNWEYVRSFIKIKHELEGDDGDYQAVQLWQNGENAGLVTYHEDRNFLGCVMPLRPADGALKLPSWLREKATA